MRHYHHVNNIVLLCSWRNVARSQTRFVQISALFYMFRNMHCCVLCSALSEWPSNHAIYTKPGFCSKQTMYVKLHAPSDILFYEAPCEIGYRAITGI